MNKKEAKSTIKIYSSGKNTAHKGRMINMDIMFPIYPRCPTNYMKKENVCVINI